MLCWFASLSQIYLEGKVKGALEGKLDTAKAMLGDGVPV